jgi:hypothetical protein
MLALLKLIPLKDWFYCTVICALLGGFVTYTIHERHIGEARIIAADTRAALVAQAKDKAIEAAAQDASNAIGVVYEKAVAIPSVADLGVVCHAPARSQLSQAPVNQSGATDSANSPVGPPYDPTGPALTVGRNADSQIRALQDQLKVLVDAMNGVLPK